MFTVKKHITEALVIWAEDKEGDWQLSLSMMIFKGDDIKLKTEIGTILVENLAEALQAYLHLPILINIVGDCVFDKIIKGKKPNISDILGVSVENKQDFMLQVFEENHHSFYGAVIRKNTLENLLQYMPLHHTRVLSLYLGRFLPSVFLASFIPNFQQRNCLVSRKDSQFIFEKGEIIEQESLVTFEKIAFSNYFQGENIVEDKLEMYAHLLLLRISPQICTIGAYTAKYESFIKEKYRTQLLQLTSGILGLILFIFLIQFWALKYENYQQGEQYSVEEPQIQRLTSNIVKIKDYQQLSQQVTSLNQSYVSWMLDKFAYIKPSGIHFTRCVYHPSEEEWKAKDGGKIPTSDFLIEGLCPQSSDISVYVSELEQLSFIKKVEVWDSQFDFQNEKHHFFLSINCK